MTTITDNSEKSPNGDTENVFEAKAREEWRPIEDGPDDDPGGGEEIIDLSKYRMRMAA